MATPLDIIIQAQKKAGVLGVGQTPNAEDTNDAFLDLKDLIAQWQRKRWLVPYLVDYSKVSTGAVSYTVGPGQDFDISRPDRLEDGCFLRQLVNSEPNAIDVPLEIIPSHEDYSKIALKQLAAFSGYIFYDSAYPTARVYPYPVPQAAIYEIHILVKADLGQLSTLVQQIVLPPEYMAALKFNLAQRLRQAYQLPEDKQLSGLAKDSLNLIRAANTQVQILSMPRSLMRPQLYNIYSDKPY